MNARQIFHFVLEILPGVALLVLGVVLVTTCVRAQTLPPVASPVLLPVQNLSQPLIDQQRETPQGADTSRNIPLDILVDQIPELGPTFRVQQIVLTGPGGLPLTRNAVPRLTLDATTVTFAGHEIDRPPSERPAAAPCQRPCLYGACHQARVCLRNDIGTAYSSPLTA